MKETALAAMGETSKKTLENPGLFQKTTEQYLILGKQASALEAELALARDLKSLDHGLWKGVQRQEIRDFLAGIIVC